MSLKHSFSIILLTCTSLLTIVPLSAQEEQGEIIIISERVGKEIDQEERNKSNLFQEVKGFQSAVYIKLSDNRYFLKKTNLDDNIDPGRLSTGEQWLIGPKFGVSVYTGFLGIEIQRIKWSLNAGLAHNAACFGIKYYLSDLNKAWYLGTFWIKGFKNNDEDMFFGFGGGHRWLYNNGFNWGLGVFIGFPKYKEKRSDSPPGIGPELYLGYSF